MKQTRAQAFNNAEPLIQPGRPVTIVGPNSRSWYRDDGVLLELLEYVVVLQATCAILGESPFLLCARRAMQLAGITVPAYSIDTPEADEHFQESELLIVLGPRVTTRVEDVPYVERAVAAHKGVLVIWANGNADYHRIL